MSEVSAELKQDFIDYVIPRWQADYRIFAREALSVNLDPDQNEILHSAQHNRRTSVRSGNARGKDYVAAVAAASFLLLNYPSKVILTAPTGRQVTAIMMAEIKSLYAKAQRNSPFPLGGRVLNDMIKFEDDVHYLIGFKAGDKATENWSGFHSPNIMVVVTEASGIDDITFNAIEGVLQGNSRFLIVYNPNNLVGEAYRSSRSPQYAKFRLNCMNAPNVVNKLAMIKGEITEKQYKKLHIPGQVDFEWVNEKIEKPGWVTMIPKADAKGLDFEWLGKWYTPNDLFRIKVLGEFPDEDEFTLVPIAWIEAAFDRWDEIMAKGFEKTSDPLRLGVDIAGMGRDNSIFTHRYGDVVTEYKFMPVWKKTPTIHMEIAGIVAQYLGNPATYAFLDTIGEGAGVFSRLREQKYTNAISAKASFNAKGLVDETGVRKFANMRAFMYWSLRDRLNPVFGHNFALPRNDMLLEELSEMTFELDSQGRIQIEAKEDIIERLNRSPDIADSVALTFFPEAFEPTRVAGKKASKDRFGLH